MRIRDLTRKLGTGLSYLTPLGSIKLYNSAMKYYDFRHGRSKLSDSLGALFLVGMTEPLKLAIQYDVFNQLLLHSKGLSLPEILFYFATAAGFQYFVKYMYSTEREIKELKRELERYEHTAPYDVPILNHLLHI